ncbi:hypothetical protein BDZ45DRAFT_349038 [Acephala macrosclerotiorum]|nr:hypothetical protein BDZ45DRAFT_349038 [Acephala macrosclerotiorum]
MECNRTEAEKVLRAPQPFRYQPLPTPTSIKLLKIEDADNSSDFIHVSLVVVDLDQNPQFDALSYPRKPPAGESLLYAQTAQKGSWQGWAQLGPPAREWAREIYNKHKTHGVIIKSTDLKLTDSSR